MPSQLFRNIDRAAGIAGNVMTRDRAMKQQLLQQHLARMNESALVRQRADRELDTNMRVRKVAEGGLNKRAQLRSDTDIKMANIRNKKMDRWSYLRKQGVSEQKINMLETGEMFYKENVDALSGPAAWDMSPDRVKFHKKNMIRGDAMMSVALESMNTELFGEARKRFNEMLKGYGFFKKPKENGSVNDTDIDTKSIRDMSIEELIRHGEFK